MFHFPLNLVKSDNDSGDDNPLSLLTKDAGIDKNVPGGKLLCISCSKKYFKNKNFHDTSEVCRLYVGHYSHLVGA